MAVRALVYLGHPAHFHLFRNSVQALRVRGREILFVIKKKMERDLFTRGRIMKPGTKALILLTGDPRVSMTRASAQYLLANMILYAQTHGVSSCLMDSLRLTLTSSKMKRSIRPPG